MKHVHHHLLSGLYAITDASITDADKTIRNVEQALQGGAKIIQFRDKSTNDEQRLHTCMAIRKLTQQANALFIVNDDVELTIIVNADGVHLGKDDASVKQAREQVGRNRIIGVSCYNRFDIALEAVNQGADYVAFGSFYSSDTKPNAVKAEVSLLQKAKRELDIPVVAIGGITVDNGKTLIEAGADMLAVVNGIFGQTDLALAARRFCSMFNSA